jgi:phage major head subunit gpT-like protein
MQLTRHLVEDAIATFIRAVAVVRADVGWFPVCVKPKYLVVPPTLFLEETLFEERLPNVVDAARSHVISRF